MNVSFSHVYPVESLLQIQFSKPSNTTKIVHQYSGHGKVIFYCDGIQSTKINTELPVAIIFLNKEHGRRKRTLTKSDYAKVTHINHLLLNFHFLEIWITIGTNVDGVGVWSEVNVMVMSKKGGGGVYGIGKLSNE